MRSFTTAVFVTIVLLAGVSVSSAQVSIGVTIGPPSATASGLRGTSTAYSRVRVDRRLLVFGEKPLQVA